MCSPTEKRCHLENALLGFYALLKTLDENNLWHYQWKDSSDFRDVRMKTNKTPNHKSDPY